MDKKFQPTSSDLLDNLNKIKKIYTFSEIDSTNEEAKRIIIDKGIFDFIVVSSSQSKGKGRNKNSFYSPYGSGIYFTLVLNERKDISDTLLLTSIAAVAVRNSIYELTNKDCYIKWVNDIYVDDKKVCGILSEYFQYSDKNYVILGIGINLTTDFPDELKNIAGNIGKIDKEKLIALCVNQITDLYDKLPDRDFIDEYTKYSNILGKEISYESDGETKFGKAIAFNENCNLVVSESGIEKTLTGGEIHIRKT